MTIKDKLYTIIYMNPPPLVVIVVVVVVVVVRIVGR